MKTFLKANWQNIIMANYKIDVHILLPYLPKGVELDLYEGECYVSLVGFLFKDSVIFNTPIPFLGTFEEVNLRFYVIRKVDNEKRRGVVFINETVPNKIVAGVANLLYKEHYISVPTRHDWTFANDIKEICYQWKVNSKWNTIKVKALTNYMPISTKSMEEYIFEHYYGYTKVNDFQSIEYKVNHPTWHVNTILDYEITCDFNAFYGPDFEILNHTKPHSVMIAEGSDVEIDWKRIRF
ncbi:MAG: DUF2071 domain-containing protein [Bacteroidota bacterium]|nr:DUF2071 domain-containing protein [Bacteroidota bacterium]